MFGAILAAILIEEEERRCREIDPDYEPFFSIGSLVDTTRKDWFITLGVSALIMGLFLAPFIYFVWDFEKSCK